MYKTKQIDMVTYSIIMDKLEHLSTRLYDESIDTVNASYELDEIIEEIKNNIIGE